MATPIHIAQLLEQTKTQISDKDIKQRPIHLKSLAFALELFLRCELAHVNRTPVKLTQVARKILSQTIQESELPESAKKALRKFGMKYVGEIYRRYWFKDTLLFRKVLQFLEINKLPQISLGAAVDHNFIIASGWIPPYWNDANFLARLRMPIYSWKIEERRYSLPDDPATVFLPYSPERRGRTNFSEICMDAIDTLESVGTLFELRDMIWSKKNANHDEVCHQLLFHSDHILHAALFLPKNWRDRKP